MLYISHLKEISSSHMSFTCPKHSLIFCVYDFFLKAYFIKECAACTKKYQVPKIVDCGVKV